jgi:hypothetical protein
METVEVVHNKDGKSQPRSKRSWIVPSTLAALIVVLALSFLCSPYRLEVRNEADHTHAGEVELSSITNEGSLRLHLKREYLLSATVVSATDAPLTARFTRFKQDEHFACAAQPHQEQTCTYGQGVSWDFADLDTAQGTTVSQVLNPGLQFDVVTQHRPTTPMVREHGGYTFVMLGDPPVKVQLDASKHVIDVHLLSSGPGTLVDLGGGRRSIVCSSALICSGPPTSLPGARPNFGSTTPPQVK